MRVSAFSIPDLNRSALIAPGYTFMTITLFLVLLFIFIYIIILPISCFLFPSNESRSSYGLSSCSFSWSRSSWENTHGANYFCLNVPEFDLFPFMVIAVVAIAYVVYSFEKK